MMSPREAAALLLIVKIAERKALEELAIGNVTRATEIADALKEMRDFAIKMHGS